MKNKLFFEGEGSHSDADSNSKKGEFESWSLARFYTSHFSDSFSPVLSLRISRLVSLTALSGTSVCQAEKIREREPRNGPRIS